MWEQADPRGPGRGCCPALLAEPRRKVEKSGRHRNLKSPKSLCFPSVRIPKVVSVNPPGQLQKLIAGCLMETTLIKQYVVKWEKKIARQKENPVLPCGFCLQSWGAEQLPIWKKLEGARLLDRKLAADMPSWQSSWRPPWCRFARLRVGLYSFCSDQTAVRPRSQWQQPRLQNISPTNRSLLGLNHSCVH